MNIYAIVFFLHSVGMCRSVAQYAGGSLHPVGMHPYSASLEMMENGKRCTAHGKRGTANSERHSDRSARGTSARSGGICSSTQAVWVGQRGIAADSSTPLRFARNDARRGRGVKKIKKPPNPRRGNRGN
jgi:hypothetical protein